MKCINASEFNLEDDGVLIYASRQEARLIRAALNRCQKNGNLSSSKDIYYLVRNLVGEFSNCGVGNSFNYFEGMYKGYGEGKKFLSLEGN